MPDAASSRDAFIRAAVGSRRISHLHGALVEANSLLAANAALANLDIHTAAILGTDAAVRHLLAGDPALATAKSAPYDWDALTHLCFSRYLRLDAGAQLSGVRCPSGYAPADQLLRAHGAH